ILKSCVNHISIGSVSTSTPPSTKLYTLSLHVALPISHATGVLGRSGRGTAEHYDMLGQVDIITSTLGKALGGAAQCLAQRGRDEDRKSTRLNSSHLVISYAVFCLKKKNNTEYPFLYHR